MPKVRLREMPEQYERAQVKFKFGLGLGLVRVQVTFPALARLQQDLHTLEGCDHSLGDLVPGRARVTDGD